MIDTASLRRAPVGLGRWTRTAALTLLVVLAIPSDSTAQEERDDDLSVAVIQSRIAALSSLPDDERLPIERRYRSAIASLDLALRSAQRKAELQQLAHTAPEELARVRAALGQEAPPLAIDDALALPKVRERLARASARMQKRRAELAQLEQESTRRSAWRVDSTAREAEIAIRLEALRRELADASHGGADRPRLAVSTGIALRAEQRALRTERDLLIAERASYEDRHELLPARIDLARLQAERAQRAVEAWQELEAEKQRQQAEAAVAEAKELRTAVRKIPQLEGLAKENQALASSRTGPEGLAARIQEATAALDERRVRLSELRESFRVIRLKVEAAGVTRAMGRLLRLQLDELPDIEALRQQLQRYDTAISDVQFDLILREGARRGAGAVQQRAKVLVLMVPAERREAARPIAEELLVEHRDLLDALIREQTLLLERLVALKEATRALIEASQAYRTYIEERILWVRSVSKSSWRVMPAAGPALGYLFAAESWPDALERTWEGVRAAPGWPILWGLGVAAIWLLALGFSRKRLEALCERAWTPNEDSLCFTQEGILHAFAQAAPIPATLLAGSQLLGYPPDQLEIGRSWSTGLALAAATVLVLRFFSVLLRPQGLGEKHFRWRSQVTASLRLHLRWFTPLAGVTSFFIAALDRQSTTEWNDSLGLLAFVTQMFALSFVLQRVLRPSAPLLSSYLQRGADGWIARLRYLWLPVTIGLPAALAVFALFGFHYSALLLYGRLEATCLLLLALVITNANLERWLALARLRLVLQAAKERKERKEREDREEEGDADPSSEVADGDAAPPELTEDSQTELSANSRQLISSGLVVLLLLGLYAVWSDVLPALKRLERLQVYPSLAVVPTPDGESRFAALQDPAQETAAAGEESDSGSDDSSSSAASAESEASAGSATSPLPPAPAPSEVESDLPERVTVADVGLSLVLILMTALFARNLPSLLQIVILSRLPIDAGLRFAIVTVFRYGIVMIGGALALNMAGINWSSVQWLAAALTFGLAFGLQEIFANFVSGLIILFERPIRVGDAVTVGDVSGTVTRLKMRATTITDWDNKELIIPNREFVTGQIINWSLSSPHMRLRLPVGIAYGSKTREAKEILLEAARDHPLVLEDPAPTAFLMEFGASTLDFELRVFIPHPRHRFDVRDELLDDVYCRFADAGIEISFPQQDVHLKASQPILDALSTPDEDAVEEVEEEKAGSTL